MISLIKITIPNWSKYNPRSDRANYSWFRFENSFFQDHHVFEMSDSQRVLFIALICEASKKNKNEIEVSPNLLAAFLNSTAQKIIENIQSLAKAGVIETATCQPNGGKEPSSLPATIRTNERDDTNETYIAPAQPAPSENPVSFYCERYKARYGHNPVIGKKQAGILTRFAKNHPSRWKDLIRGYLEMPDSWAVQRSHPVEIIETKINEIVRYLETGKVVTKKVIEHAEEIIDKAQGTNRRPRKSIEELEAENKAMRQGSPLQIVGES